MKTKTLSILFIASSFFISNSSADSGNKSLGLEGATYMRHGLVSYLNKPVLISDCNIQITIGVDVIKYESKVSQAIGLAYEFADTQRIEPGEKCVDMHKVDGEVDSNVLVALIKGASYDLDRYDIKKNLEYFFDKKEVTKAVYKIVNTYNYNFINSLSYEDSEKNDLDIRYWGRMTNGIKLPAEILDKMKETLLVDLKNIESRIAEPRRIDSVLTKLVILNNNKVFFEYDFSLINILVDKLRNDFPLETFEGNHNYYERRLLINNLNVVSRLLKDKIEIDFSYVPIIWNEYL